MITASVMKVLNIPPEDDINCIANVEKKTGKLFNNLYDNNKISKMGFSKFVL